MMNYEQKKALVERQVAALKELLKLEGVDVTPTPRPAPKRCEKCGEFDWDHCGECESCPTT